MLFRIYTYIEKNLYILENCLCKCYKKLKCLASQKKTERKDSEQKEIKTITHLHYSWNQWFFQFLLSRSFGEQKMFHELNNLCVTANYCTQPSGKTNSPECATTGAANTIVNDPRNAASSHKIYLIDNRLHNRCKPCTNRKNKWQVIILILGRQRHELWWNCSK